MTNEQKLTARLLEISDAPQTVAGLVAELKEKNLIKQALNVALKTSQLGIVARVIDIHEGRERDRHVYLAR